ncbi:MAG: biopolymer transporter ExbD [Planctomycetota bacterium]|nr:MAG: biopolymer transporter ExbD [Planctomycetota bacterium]REJ94922.1 MAG: biopolymer transporter ExbD [Planctomycetota bacterium]REK26513.1 MAG: biopolymer transporter ExbD [Planctomycetota bacterium]REK33966.1 MAG: biopolymer transporter ExbD [Planctomycetota bacterium]
MPLKLEPMEEPSLNLTPMIDVVLQLVIFFLVGTEFIKTERQYEVDLPEVTEAQPLTNLPDELVVNITRDGRFFLGRKGLSAEELQGELRAAADRYADQSVVIRADGSGPYQHVMTALNICHRAGISNIQLANRVGSESAP